MCNCFTESLFACLLVLSERIYVDVRENGGLAGVNVCKHAKKKIRQSLVYIYV